MLVFNLIVWVVMRVCRRKNKLENPSIVEGTKPQQAVYFKAMLHLRVKEIVGRDSVGKKKTEN